MGACQFDTQKGGRNIAAKYALNTVDGVKQILEDIPILKERRYHAGDFDACDILIDIQGAIDDMMRSDHAYKRLTSRQLQALDMYHIQGYELNEIAGVMGVTQHTVKYHAERACEKIAEYFASWNYNEI